MEDLIRELLVRLGEDPRREGLVRTPVRVEKALKFLTSGYSADIDAVLKGAPNTFSGTSFQDWNATIAVL